MGYRKDRLSVLREIHQRMLSKKRDKDLKLQFNLEKKFQVPNDFKITDVKLFKADVLSVEETLSERLNYVYKPRY